MKNDLSKINKKFYCKFKKLGKKKKDESLKYLTNLSPEAFKEELRIKRDVGKKRFKSIDDIYESDEERAASYMLVLICREIENKLSLKRNSSLIVNPQQPVHKYIKFNDDYISEFDWDDYRDTNRWRRFDFVIEYVYPKGETDFSKYSYKPLLFIECWESYHYEPYDNKPESLYKHRKCRLNDEFKMGISEMLDIKLVNLDVREWKEKFFNTRSYPKNILSEYAEDIKHEIRKALKKYGVQ